VVRIFLLGIASRNQTEYRSVPAAVIEKETEAEKDIVQGNFVEHYHNLTYKHVMGLMWVTKHCRNVKFVIKMDDDIAVDLFQMRRLIKINYRNSRNLIAGLIQIGNAAIRSNSSKWKVSKSEYSSNRYPDFVSGWCYIASIDVIHKVVESSRSLPYFWIDDVFVTGILAEKLRIHREGINYLFATHTAQLKCCYEEYFLPYEYLCDFLAAPTGGDASVMMSSLSQFSYCFKAGCAKRPSLKRLIHKCVSAVNHNIKSLGVGEVEILK